MLNDLHFLSIFCYAILNIARNAAGRPLLVFPLIIAFRIVSVPRVCLAGVLATEKVQYYIVIVGPSPTPQ